MNILSDHVVILQLSDLIELIVKITLEYTSTLKEISSSATKLTKTVEVFPFFQPEICS